MGSSGLSPDATGQPVLNSGVEDWFRSFLHATLGSPPSTALEPFACRPWEFDASAKEPQTGRWLNRGAALIAHQTPRQQQHHQELLRQLTASIQGAAAEIGPANFEECFSRAASISSACDYPIAAGRDFIYCKINHGFWEQIHALLARDDPARRRLQDPERFRPAYLDSLFLDALLTAMRLGSACVGDEVIVSNLHFGLSLGNGDLSHASRREASRRLAHETVYFKIQMCAAIGCVGVLRDVFAGRRLRADDGSFPRCGLLAGGLARTLQACAAQADRLVHVVPPHLAGLRLLGTDRPQECWLIPPRTVHQCWFGALEDILAGLIARLAMGQRLLVLTQSAVFSALLALTLARARRDLVPEAGQLWFLDLGQVLDLAAPDRGGPWLKGDAVRQRLTRHQVEPLFTLSEATP